ncbi:MAG TPA: M67 family metallopeptidase [Anaerolineales bacterium]|nr:M67 family metallopeptidase [Anaerolineales bacterium]
MSIVIHPTAEDAIRAHLEAVYPEEGAGFLLGEVDGDDVRRVRDVIPAGNARENGARRTRYLITPLDTYEADLAAEARGLEVVGVFHSHPDVPNVPSEFDREWALPWYSYTITRVDGGRATNTRSWRLTDDRERFIEEELLEKN